jgi:hypothetical protein
MSLNGPSYFHVEVTPAGNLLLRGELDLATVQDLQDRIDGIMVPGQAIVLGPGSTDLPGYERHPSLCQG